MGGKPSFGEAAPMENLEQSVSVGNSATQQPQIEQISDNFGFLYSKTRKEADEVVAAQQAAAVKWAEAMARAPVAILALRMKEALQKVESICD